MYAHSHPARPKSAWDPLSAHLQRVADEAGCLAEAFGAGPWAHVAGLLHDLGKSSAEFQHRLEGGSAVDHSTAGAREIVKRWGAGRGALLAYAIAGHHGGLPDWAELNERLHHRRLPLYDSGLMPVPSPPLPPFTLTDGFGIGLLIRMLFSCLVDADHRDTARFFADADGRAEPEPRWASLAALKARLDQHLDRKCCEAADTLVNRHRAQVLAQCRAKAALPPGLFSLTVPTGGGKTLSSLAFALDHALRHGMRRVIYAIPFTSIIEQTARAFRQALHEAGGEEVVLEHHSNYRHPGDADGNEFDDPEMVRIATQTWDAPLIVTTNVQLFESLFGNRPSRCRKLHNIAGAVIILDEAQTLPTELLRPCLEVLRALVANYRVTVVLCTATQPALDRSEWMPEGLDGVREIIDRPEALYDALRRVRVETIGRLTDGDLAERLARLDQALCIVNTRAHARAVHDLLAGADGTFHLSALMCPEHRSRRLATIRERLNDGAACRVITTPLIEAGVDVDFPVVFRALAGLDSIAQAAGRCNREGLRAAGGTVHVFEPDRSMSNPYWQRRIAMTKAVQDRFEDLLGPDAVRRYFQQLYDAEELDRHGILPLLGHGGRGDTLCFRTAAEKFRLIADGMDDVVIPYDEEARATIAALRYVERPGSLLRQLQRYTVQIYPWELAALSVAGAVERIADQFWVLVNEDLYDAAVGLRTADPTWLGPESTIL